MKKKSYIIFALLILGFAAASCVKEVEEETVQKHEQTPELVAAGEYIGNWIRVSGTDTLTAAGSIVLEADTAYCTYVSFISEEFSLSKTAVANISYADSGFVYFNNNGAANGLGSAFAGRIDGNKVNTLSVTISQLVNRRVKKFFYTFNGVKQ